MRIATATAAPTMSTSAVWRINIHNPLQLQFVEETMKRCCFRATIKQKKYFTYCGINLKKIIAGEYQLVRCARGCGLQVLSKSMFNVEQPLIMSYPFAFEWYTTVTRMHFPNGLWILMTLASFDDKCKLFLLQSSHNWALNQNNQSVLSVFLGPPSILLRIANHFIEPAVTRTQMQLKPIPSN